MGGGGVASNQPATSSCPTHTHPLPHLTHHQGRVLKMHGGYHPRTPLTSINLLALDNAKAALAHLGALTPELQASWDNLEHSGPDQLPQLQALLPAAPPRAPQAPAAPPPTPQLQLQHQPAPATPQLQPKPEQLEPAAAATPAAAAAMEDVLSQLPSLTPQQLGLLQFDKPRYGLKAIAPHLIQAEPLASQLTAFKEWTTQAIRLDRPPSMRASGNQK